MLFQSNCVVTHANGAHKNKEIIIPQNMHMGYTGQHIKHGCSKNKVAQVITNEKLKHGFNQ